jgi:ornithine carbamoyltransferase
MKKDLISIADFSGEELAGVFQLAAELKEKQKKGEKHHLLAGKILALIFEKPSLRTRVTFEGGMYQLGGAAIYLAPSDIGLGQRESVADTARNLERWVEGVMARTFSHQVVMDLAASCSIPVINGLTDLLHPCQVLADVFTVIENFGLDFARPDLSGLRVVFVGDGNNVANSWINAASVLKFELAISCPRGHEPDEKIWRTALKQGARVKMDHNPLSAVEGAQIIYTDVWASMGREAEAAERKKIFRSYQVNADLIKVASPDVRVMHCLPAHREEEITSEVMDGPHSIVLDQAENRLHLQKAVLAILLGRES